MMKKILALTLALAMSLSFAGCGAAEPPAPPKEEPPTTATTPTPPATEPEATTPGESTPSTTPTATTGKTMVWNLGADPKTLDPTLNSASDGGKVILNVYEGLMRDKFDGQGLQPAMASEAPAIVENEDGTVTYTFKLRDAKWSDGEPVKAQDFVFSWKRAVNPATAAEYAYILDPIVNAKEITAGDKTADELGVKAIDDKTLEVVLKQNCGYFMELLNFPTFMPLREDIVGADTEGVWAKESGKVISNGPFTMSEYVMGDHITLNKNANYWNADSVKLDSINVKMIVDQGTSLTGFKNGEIDFMDSPPVEEVQQLMASGDCELFPYISTYFYAINQNTNIEALKNQKVRQALSMAIDRKAITENVSRSGEKPAFGYVPFGFTTPDGKDFREVAGDYYLKETAQIEEAKALLVEAGYPGGEGIPQLEILYNTLDSHKAIAEAIQQMWKAIGIDCVLNNQEWAVFQDTRTNLQYQSVVRHGWNGDYLDPMTFMDMFITGNPQAGCGYSNPEYDKQLGVAANSTGKEHYDAFLAAEKTLIEDAYVMPIYYATQKVMANPKVVGFGVGAIGKYWFGDTDIVA